MDDDAIIAAVRAHPGPAAQALGQVQTTDRPLTAPVIEVLARYTGRDVAEVWVEQLKQAGLVTPFVAAIRGLGVAFDDDVLEDPEKAIPSEPLQRFLAAAHSFRCQIRKNGVFAGSGVLLGPSLVLTAWHVIAVAGPGRPQVPPPTIEVRLADGTVWPARLPAAFQSECGDDEYQRHRAPDTDDEVDGRDDIALLELDRPAGTHLAHVALPAPGVAPRRGGRLVVVHAPAGEDTVDFGQALPIVNVTSRWRHDVRSASGSSGGACFDRELRLVGVHQAAFDSGARFVPAARFVDQIADTVRTDLVPAGLWSLDGTVEGAFVIGRQAYFDAIAAAGEPETRVRGVRITWAGAVPPAGLAYSHDILRELLRRRGAGHRLVRIPQNEVVDDMTAEIRRWATASGLALLVDAPAPVDGPPETTARGRAERLVADIEAAAATAGEIVWIYIDHPTVVVTESRRLVLESLVRASLVSPHLRLVLAGMNDFAFAGEQFRRRPASADDRPPGLMVEYLGGFRRSDVVAFLRAAARALGGEADDAVLEWEATRALESLEDINHVYDSAQLPALAEALRPGLRVLARGTS